MTEQLLRKDHRYIIKRIIIRGNLVLETPTALGSGDAEGLTDLILLRDTISNCALLTGSSIAGALRNYLHEYEQGYLTSEKRQGLASQLFGSLFSYDEENADTENEENQSDLIIDDAISSKLPVVELRDGVKIELTTGTAEDGAKYDLELLEAGTTFPLCFELLIEKDANEIELKKALFLALRGLDAGKISIGMKKRRGFGQCRVKEWKLWQFDLQKHEERIAWLKFDHQNREILKGKSFESIISQIKGVSFNKQIDSGNRDIFSISAKFKLVTPLLIRSSQNLIPKSTTVNKSKSCAPDVVHLNSKRDGNTEPVAVVSGTSLCGVLRHRAARIVNTFSKDIKIIDNLFGFVQGEQAQASRLVIQESVIENTAEIVQSRIAIDRFTGGAYHGALFSEQPIFGVKKIKEQKKSKKDKKNLSPNDDSKHFEINIQLHKPHKEQYEIGLLLLLLKDLWTGDLPIGGTTSIGRGRLQGLEATITWQQPNKPIREWVIYQNKEKLKVDEKTKQQLEEFVQAFINKAP